MAVACADEWATAGGGGGMRRVGGMRGRPPVAVAAAPRQWPTRGGGAEAVAHHTRGRGWAGTHQASGAAADGGAMAEVGPVGNGAHEVGWKCAGPSAAIGGRPGRGGGCE